MKKHTKVVFSLLLVVCMLISGVTKVIPAVAVEADNLSSGSVAEDLPGEAVSPDDVALNSNISIVEEDFTLRGEYEKHFLMSDGSYQAVVYSYPVHELVEGVWVEIKSTTPNARTDVTTDNAKQNIIDNYVLQGYGVQNKSLDRLYIGNRSAGLTRAYIQFAAMPTIPSGATITAATMTLHFTSGTSTAANASAYQVTEREWASGEIQWSNKPAANVLLQSNIGHNNVTGYTFSCLTAVQHWYDGDTTGQNENYGIMLRYYDENTDDYNAVWSADCTDASLRPSLTIRYQPANSAIDVDEGDTITLSVSGTTGTVTWTSSDTSIATINSGGVLTGIKAGKVTVRAYVNGTEYKTFTVYVTISDGVYRLRNSVGLYLATYGSVAENTGVKLLGYSNNGFNQTCQLWRITYLGSGYYSIRPMHKLNMGLHASGNTGSSADIVSIGMKENLSEVATVSRWCISANNDGGSYNLNHSTSSGLGLRAENYYTSVGMGVTIGQNSGGSVFNWQFEQVTGVFLHNDDSEPINLDEAIDVEVEMGMIHTPENMGIYVTTSSMALSWSSTGSAISVDQNGRVAASHRGKGTVTGLATAGSTSKSFQINVKSLETVSVKNYYDSTMSVEERDSISAAITFLNETFKDKFYLRYVMVNNLTHYTGAIDSCYYGSESACTAGNGSNCSYDVTKHHKNIIRIRDELSPVEDNAIAVLWSNTWAWIYCDGVDANSHSHLPGGIMALVTKTNNLTGDPSNVIQVLSIDKYAQVKEKGYSDTEIMSIILAHEVAHTLGMKEVYEPGYYINPPHCYESNSSSNTVDCIMESFDCVVADEFYSLVVQGRKSAMCAACVSILSSEIEDDVYEN